MSVREQLATRPLHFHPPGCLSRLSRCDSGSVSSLPCVLACWPNRSATHGKTIDTWAGRETEKQAPIPHVPLLRCRSFRAPCSMPILPCGVWSCINSGDLLSAPLPSCIMPVARLNRSFLRSDLTPVPDFLPVGFFFQRHPGPLHFVPSVY
ncbi:hypothetical protein GQ53DRAFT_244827 [Thozetella sp. PMI_491]|nr:hypothetical protein GQ53DRAFT_244827 [Thozetella sp. PMI_491]